MPSITPYFKLIYKVLSKVVQWSTSPSPWLHDAIRALDMAAATLMVPERRVNRSLHNEFISIFSSR